MNKILVLQSGLGVHGGGHAVAAWTLEALRSLGEVTLLTWAEPDWDALNRYFGTSLQRSAFKLECVSPLTRRLFRHLPTASFLLIHSILLRRCQQLDRIHHYDAMVSTNNEVDFGRRGIQYIHAPRAFAPAPHEERHWYHGAPGLLRAYRSMCRRIAGTRPQRALANLTLVNSAFIAAEVRRLYGIESTVLPPPVPGPFPQVAWQDRRDDFIWIGRLHPHKRLEDAVAIVAGVRALGHPARLTVVGTRDEPRYFDFARELAARHRDWMSLHLSITRTALGEILTRHRYALHTMIDEHFGIAVAEFLRGGCIPFVHASGGPLEIVGDPRLAFADCDTAVEKIATVLRDETLRTALLEHLRARRELYSERRFIEEMRAVVTRFVQSGAGGS